MKLYLALKDNNEQKVAECLRGIGLADDEFFDDKMSFLSWAVLNNCNEKIVEMLIANGFNVNRISFLAYNWPRDGQRFNSFEPALITATRHGNYWPFNRYLNPLRTKGSLKLNIWQQGNCLLNKFRTNKFIIEKNGHDIQFHILNKMKWFYLGLFYRPD